MVKVATSSSVAIHTGSTAVGPVTSTVSVGSNDFVYIENELIMIEDGTLNVPSHIFDLGPPPQSHSHTFTTDTFLQDFVFVENKKVVLVGDNYSSDITTVTTSGGNDFVEII